MYSCVFKASTSADRISVFRSTSDFADFFVAEEDCEAVFDETEPVLSPVAAMAE
jgi:hypothetical protein